LSDRALGRPPQARGANKGRTVNIEKMMSDYWGLFDWDPETGIPTAGTLKKHGIEI
jgi:aldehyde:ferredoxin oxidoreductase